MSASGSRRWWVASRSRSNRSSSRLTQRVDRAELVGDEDLPAGAGDARELRDGELGAAHVMEHAVAADEVELRVAERQRHDVALDWKRTFAGAAARAASR